MFFARLPIRSVLTSLIAVGMGAVVASCAPSRAVQCQRLSDVARTVQETAQPAVSGRTQAIARAATGFTAAIDQINQLGSLDEDLVGVQVALRNVYGNSGEATDQFLTALESRDRAQATAAVQRLETLAQEEQAALEQLSRQCYPESKAPESKAPESKAPESKAPESKAPKPEKMVIDGAPKPAATNSP